MPVEGYTGRGSKLQPDIGWWTAQLTAGKEYRKKYASESEWPKWREMYRGNWNQGTLPVNLFFTMLRTIVPRIYFRSPSVSVKPAQNGMEAIGFSRILERLDNKIIREMKLKKHMKRVVQETFMYGTGFAKVGFGGTYNPFLNADSGEPLDGVDKQGNFTEYSLTSQSNMPWVQRQRTSGMIVPAGLQDYETTRWVASEYERPLSDLKRDPRFKNVQGLVSEASQHGIKTQRMQKIVRLQEIRDMATGMAIVMSAHSGSPAKDRVLYMGEDLTREIGLPYHPLQFNPDDEVFWAIPDSRILEPQQLELNETKTQIMKHRRLALVRILVKSNMISDTEAQKLISEDVSPVISINSQGALRDAVMLFQGGDIPEDLILNAREVMNDVRETIGFSRNQFGEYNPGSSDTTATEANIVRQASEIRVDERRDETADMLTDIVNQINYIIFEHWTSDDVIDIVGPNNVPLWVKFSGNDLNSTKHTITVDPESGTPETRQMREQRAVGLYQLLMQDPLINPVERTRMMLQNIEGYTSDDIMRLLPMAEGFENQGPDNPLDANGLGQLLTQSVAQGATNAQSGA